MAEKIKIGDKVRFTGSNARWFGQEGEVTGAVPRTSLVRYRITKPANTALSDMFNTVGSEVQIGKDYLTVIETKPKAKNKSKVDVVNDPQHYGGKDNPYEVIKVLEAWGLDEDAYLFNVIKYLSRAGKKDPDKTLQDHKKALYYLNRKIAKLEKESK